MTQSQELKMFLKKTEGLDNILKMMVLEEVIETQIPT
jgi:hypothetical protein